MTAFMPRRVALDDPSVQHGAVSDCPSSPTIVSVPGKPCATHASCRFAPARISIRPKSPRSDAHGPM
jgi:hypothetical protein